MSAWVERDGKRYRLRARVDGRAVSLGSYATRTETAGFAGMRGLFGVERPGSGAANDLGLGLCAGMGIGWLVGRMAA